LGIRPREAVGVPADDGVNRPLLAVALLAVAEHLVEGCARLGLVALLGVVGELLFNGDSPLRAGFLGPRLLLFDGRFLILGRHAVVGHGADGLRHGKRSLVVFGLDWLLLMAPRRRPTSEWKHGRG